MSKKIFCYQHNIENYRRDTNGLTIEQHGAYRLLLDEYYFTGGRLPSDLKTLYRLVGAQNKKERSAVASAVAQFFNQEDDGFLSQNGAEKELTRITKVSTDNRRKALLKWMKYNKTRYAGACAAAMPEAMPNGCQLLTSNYQLEERKKEENEKSENLPVQAPIGNSSDGVGIFEASIGFESFWQAYPKQTGKGFARDSYRKALAKVTHEKIMESLKRYPFQKEIKFVAKPCDWLDGECWDDNLRTRKPTGHIQATGKSNAF